MLLLTGSLCTLLLSLVLTPLVRTAARHLGIVARPRQDRWHRKPTAMLGGIAIYLAFIAGALVLAPDLSDAASILLAGTVLFLTGLVDDLIQIKPLVKLAAQLGAAAAMIFAGLSLEWTAYPVVNGAVTVFWLVGITNAVNLLDNMDGLAGGTSLVSCCFLTVIFLLNGQAEAALLPALLAGAVLGFLVFNFNPASIFMGDCGSMLLGFTLGTLPLLNHYECSPQAPVALLTPVLVLLTPIFDTCLVTVTRKLAGRPVSQGGRDHTSHRLVALGLSERGAVVALYACAVLSGLLALTIRSLKTELVLLLVPGLALLVLGVGFYLGKVSVYQKGQLSPGGKVASELA
jgi:UDP-GlcNAc:undecaprenyl-phosphate GlcNAc-1-phosphate transferase